LTSTANSWSYRLLSAQEGSGATAAVRAGARHIGDKGNSRVLFLAEAENSTRERTPMR
jgi:hypothetical protein